MQPHDPEPLPDDTSRTEGGGTSTAFQPGTDRTLKIGAAVAAGILVFCFCVVMLIRLVEAHSLRKAADAAYSAAPPVDVITAQPVSVGQDLVLPGQTAAFTSAPLKAPLQTTGAATVAVLALLMLSIAPGHVNLG